MKTKLKQMYFYIGVSTNQITHEVLVITQTLQVIENVIKNNRTVANWKSTISYKA